ncbi:MAG: hypothetical protein KGI97_04890 [Alphaproteobacteria bacterium]|nr:hypothetical protein [Alphaproteobacteria bacterium]
MTALAIFFWLASGDSALAAVAAVTTKQATTLGDIICNATINGSAFGPLFSWGAYGIGAILAVQGIHHMRLHVDSPQNNKMDKPLFLWLGSALLLSLPSFIGMIVTSLYGTTAAGGGAGCNPGGAGASASTLDVMLTNFVNNIHDPLLGLVSIIAWVAGLLFVVRGLVKASKYGFDPRANSPHIILTNIVFGALLLTIGSNLDMVMGSVFGASTIKGSSVLNWSFASALGGASTSFQTAVKAGLTFVQLIGAIAFVRGWLIMKKVVEGGGNVTMAQGITHIVGGVLAINIFWFLKIMDTTFGTGLIS